MSTFRFGPYTLRPATAEDEQLLAGWIAADDDHRDRLTPSFWTEKHKGLDTMMLEDGQGHIFALRIERLARLHIQFAPATTEADRERLRDALTEGCEWLAHSLAAVGIRELVFESRVARLVAFSLRRLGFRRSPDELVRTILPAGGNEPRQKKARSAH